MQYTHPVKKKMTHSVTDRLYDSSGAGRGLGHRGVPWGLVRLMQREVRRLAEG